MTTGLKLGSGYARWRPPSKATVFTRRWWWVAALLVLAAAATFAAIAMVQSERARVAAAARARTYAPQLHYARTYLRRNGLETDGLDAVEYRQMAAFTVSLTDQQIEDLAHGIELPVSSLTAEQRRNIEAYARPNEHWGLDAIAFQRVRGVGPSFRLYGIRSRAGTRVRAALYGFPMKWREGAS